MKTSQRTHVLIALFVLLFALLAVLASGCKKEEDNPVQPSLRGEWEPVEYAIVNEMNGTREVLPIEIYVDFYDSKNVSEIYTVEGDTYNIDTTTYVTRFDSLYTTYLEGKYTLTFETLSTKKIVDVNDEGKERYVYTLFNRVQ